MTLACLAMIYPLDTASGERVALSVASANHREVNGLGSIQWEPAIVQSPTISISLFNGDFSAAIEAGSARIGISMVALRKRWAGVDAYHFAGAPIEIYTGEIGQPWPWTKRFVGKVTPGFSGSASVLTLSANVDIEPFGKDVLTATYAGTTGAEGETSLKGKVKPLVLGWASNVEPVLIDPTNSVYQFSGYGPIEEVTKLYERGSDFGAETADYADYTALVAATIPAGRWATCLASGMIRLGAPAYGVITGDIKGHSPTGTAARLGGELIAQLAEICGIDEALIDTTSLSLLDQRAPYPIDIVITDQGSFLDVMKAIALPLNAQAGVSLIGKAFVALVDFTMPAALEINANGSTWPQVKASNEAGVSAPYWRIVYGANRCWRVHTTDEIAFDVPLIDRGRYDNATTYREGNFVDLEDGSKWLYINATPGAGNAPPAHPATSNAWWTSLSPRLTGAGLVYGDGTLLDDLMPLEPLADVTANNQVAITLTADKTVAADYAGTVASGDLSAVLWSPTVKRGGTSIKLDSSTTYALSNSSGGTFAVDNTGGSSAKGNVTISAMTANSAQVDLTVTVGGLAQPKITLRLTKVLGDPPTTGSSGAYPKTVSWTGGDFTGINTTSYTAVVATKTVTLASGESLYGTAPLDYNVSGYAGDTRTMTFKWQYATAGSGSWNDFGAGITGSTATAASIGGAPDYIYVDPIPGSVAVTQTKSGLSAGDYDVRLVALDSATGRTCTPAGTATIQAKV